MFCATFIFQTRSRGCLKNFLGITFVCLVLLTCVVEKHTLLWTFYLKYKAFVDFPLSLILPLVVWLFKRQKDFNYQEKTEKDKEERKNIAKYKEDKKIEKSSVAKYKEDKEYRPAHRLQNRLPQTKIWLSKEQSNM